MAANPLTQDDLIFRPLTFDDENNSLNGFNGI